MEIRKAVVTAAAPGQRSLPLQHVVDRDGEDKTALQIILAEALGAGVEEVAVIVAPGDERAYARAAGALQDRVTFIPQAAPRGYGDALLRAVDFIGGEPFLHLVGDHLYLSATNVRCARQLCAVAAAQSCAVSAVQSTRESAIPLYGTIGGRPVSGSPGLYGIEQVIEKPTPTQAEQRLIVPGMRAGHYLCFFGLHVLTPGVLERLAEQAAAAGPDDRLQLSPALNELAGHERYLALTIAGQRFNIGVQYGLFLAQFALLLRGRDREHVLEDLFELAATLPRDTSA